MSVGRIISSALTSAFTKLRHIGVDEPGAEGGRLDPVAGSAPLFIAWL